MDRRDLLRAFGAATALTLLPADAKAAWLRVARTPGAAARALTAVDAAQVGALADVVLPRTDTPSATDVGVVAWVDLVVAEYYRDDERKQFMDGLAAIDVLAKSAVAPGSGATGYEPEAAAKLIDTIEKGEASRIAVSTSRVLSSSSARCSARSSVAFSVSTVRSCRVQPTISRADSEAQQANSPTSVVA